MLTKPNRRYDSLPFVDEHAIALDVAPEQGWQALLRAAPARGFRVTESVPERRLVLEGRHPFSRYALVFLLEALQSGGVRLRAQTWAAFPGVKGRAYRALVVGSGAHAIVVRRMLRGVAGRA